MPMFGSAQCTLVGLFPHCDQILSDEDPIPLYGLKLVGPNQTAMCCILSHPSSSSLRNMLQ